MVDSTEFLIDGILPANEVHLLGGSSGSGKTTFAFQIFLANWQQGKPFFDHESRPVPYVYASLDRSRSSVERTLNRLGLLSEITRIVCQEDIPEDAITPITTIREILKHYPDSKLIIIEGIQLLAGERGNGYTSVARVLKAMARFCTHKGVTILGVCHTPKMKIDEGFQHPRESLLGSVSWGAYSDTIIMLNLDELTKIITVNILPRNAPSEQHELIFGINGVLEPFVRQSKQHQILIRIAALSTGRPITRGEIINWGKEAKVATRTCDAAIQTALEKNILEVIGTGVYERTKECIPEWGKEKDPEINLSDTE